MDNPVKYRDRFDKRTEKTYHSVFLKSRTCPIMTDFYKKWYPEGKKIVPKDLKLSPMILLTWFLDDGHLNITYSKYSASFQIDLYSCGFSKEENEFLAGLLSEYIKSEVKICINREKYYLRMNNKSARKFIEIIDIIYPDCMLRKAKWKQLENKVQRKK